MLPGSWEKKLVDMNVTRLNDSDIKLADYVFIRVMAVQKKSVKEVVVRCKHLGAKIVAGGPLFTAGFEEFNGMDHFVLCSLVQKSPPRVTTYNGLQNPYHRFESGRCLQTYF